MSIQERIDEIDTLLAGPKSLTKAVEADLIKESFALQDQLPPPLTLDIPMGSTVLNLRGKNLGSFANHIPRHNRGYFKFGQHRLLFLWETNGFQVWQGDVSERDLSDYPQWFSTAIKYPPRLPPARKR